MTKKLRDLEKSIKVGKPKRCPKGFVDLPVRLPPLLWGKMEREAKYLGISVDEYMNNVLLLRIHSDLKVPYDFYIYTKMLRKLGNLARIQDWFHVLVPAGLTLQINIGNQNAS
jgi:hypothetical protein